MLKSAMTVGGLTLISRMLGFVRDMMMAALLGAGPLADAFMVALRLPNHFRAIFAEGAFNAAFVPTYSALSQGEPERASIFAGQILILLLVSQAALLVVAWTLSPNLVALIAPGFDDSGGRAELTVTLVQITFPYLALITMVTLASGMLNAHGRFAIAALAPTLLNLCMIGAMLGRDIFPTTAHALAWGVTVSGMAQLALVVTALWRARIVILISARRMTGEVVLFFRRFGPAVIGSAGIQMAMFADTIIASFLPHGSVSHLYYADRLNQLPIAIIGVAIGTVMLPELSRLLAENRRHEARDRYHESFGLSIFLSVPVAISFILAAEPLISLLFERGEFTRSSVAGTANVLTAYALGLPAFVALRSTVAVFHAFGDTGTPVKAMLAAMVVNIGLKILLMDEWGVAGLALATAISAWINLATLSAILMVKKGFRWDRALATKLGAILLASGPLSAWLLVPPPLPQLLGTSGISVLLLLAAGGAIYLIAYQLSHVLLQTIASDE